MHFICIYTWLLIWLAVCPEGAVRLIGSSTTNTLQGRIEVCNQNEWGTVCGNSWGMEDARVVCRQLGYQTTGESTFRV